MSTTYAPQQLPTCPSYCDGRHGDGGFEIDPVTGRPLFRLHSGGDWPSVPQDGGRHQGAEVCVLVEEKPGGDLGASKVSLHAPDVELTPERAREYARYIIEAANTAEREGGR